jgi:hypothetical protein
MSKKKTVSTGASAAAEANDDASAAGKDSGGTALFAVCRVRIADGDFAPGDRIPNKYAAQLRSDARAQLLADGSVREA